MVIFWGAWSTALVSIAVTVFLILFIFSIPKPFDTAGQLWYIGIFILKLHIDLLHNFRVLDWFFSLSSGRQHSHNKRNNSASIFCRPFNLCGSENHSSIDWYNGPCSGSLSGLQHIPVKATNDFYTLEDITANGQGLHGEHVNILCVIRKVY